MRKRKQGQLAKVIGVLVMAVFILSSFRAIATDSGQGDITNDVPYGVGTDSDALEVDGDTYDNSGSDVITFYFTFKDNNSEDDVDVDGELIVYIEPSADNDGYTDPTDTKVISWALSKTQVGDKCWIDDQGGATNGSNDDGDTDDGYFEIEDENDDDDNFEFTIPGTWSTSDYYSAQINFSDEGAMQDSYLASNFKVTTSIQYSLCYANGNWGTSYWGEWDASPSDSMAPSDVDASTISWLVVNNTGSNPTQQFTVDFTPENFTGQSHSKWINIDYNVNWAYYESAEAPGGATDPDDVDWEDTNWTSADDADGAYTFQFTALNMHMWIIYKLAQVTEDDGTGEKPVSAHNYDNVLRDDDYRADITLTPL